MLIQTRRTSHAVYRSSYCVIARRMAGTALALITSSVFVIVLAGAKVAAEPTVSDTSAASATLAPSTIPGITVTPGRLDVTLPGGGQQEQTQRKTVTVTNNYAVPIVIAVQLNGIDERSGLLVPSGVVDGQLAPSLALSETSIPIAAHASHSFDVQVTNRQSLSPGGHYVSILLTPLPIAGAAQALTLRSSISISMFIVKQAGAVTKLTVTDSNINGWLLQMPSQAIVTFANQGNVHATPRAIVRLLSQDSKQELAQGIANSQSFPLLPGKQLTSTVPLRRLVAERTTAYWPQRLHIETSYRYDGETSVHTIVQTFWYVPPVLTLATFMLMGVAIVSVWLVLRYYRRIGRRMGRVGQKTAKPGIKGLISPSLKIIRVSGDSEATVVGVKVIVNK